MSYRTWIDYGYGICVSYIEVDSVEKLEKLLSLAPKFHSDIHDYFKESQITEPTVDDYIEYDDSYFLGLASLLKEVIQEAEGIELYACDDYDFENYLIYPPMYPWQMTEKYKSMTEESLNELFRKYVSILTDEPVDIDYQSIENGG